MSLIYFIQEHLHRRVPHGGTGNADADRIWLNAGYVPVEFPDRENFSVAAKFRRAFYLYKMIRLIGKTDRLIFQYPLYAGMSKMLVRLLLSKQVKLICFITDIDGLKDGDEEKLKRDIAFFRHFSHFIVHNVAMKNWLDLQVTHSVSTMINFFDFFATPFAGNRKISNELVFAGNLSKSLFLERLDELQQPLRWNIYGQGITEKMRTQACIFYKGVIEPYLLPAKIEGSFGIVWDGDSIHGSGGVFGKYMQYISHHKISLYILAGLPIICYRHAGASEIILDYGIGLLVDDLAQVPQLIEKLDEAGYQQMRTNMQALAVRIAKGECLATATRQILADINTASKANS
jgi:hypothetical protein